MDAENKNLVVKSNRLIEAGYRLTLQEHRVLLFCIAQVNSKEKLADKTFQITADDYARTFGVKLNNAYKELKDVIDTLYNRSVKLFNKEKNIEAEIRWIQDKIYYNNEGFAQITLSTAIAPLISELKSHFTSYHLKHIAGMKSVYAIRLYELFKQFGSVGKRQIEIEWLKERLHITEIYSAFADLKKRVIEPALSEINKHSDLDVSYKLVKRARKVIAIEFTYARKSEEHGNNIIPININQHLLAELKAYGISEKQAHSLLLEFDENRIHNAISITKYNLENKTLKKSVAGFLIKAIQEGYSSYEIIEKNKNKLVEENNRKISNIKKKIEEFNSLYSKFSFKYLEERVQELSIDEQQKYIEEFLLAHGHMATLYRTKGGLENKAVKATFLSYMKNHIEVPTIQQFCTENGFDVASLEQELNTLQYSHSSLSLSQERTT